MSPRHKAIILSVAASLQDTSIHQEGCHLVTQQHCHPDTPDSSPHSRTPYTCNVSLLCGNDIGSVASTISSEAMASQESPQRSPGKQLYLFILQNIFLPKNRLFVISSNFQNCLLCWWVYLAIMKVSSPAINEVYYYIWCLESGGVYLQNIATEDETADVVFLSDYISHSEKLTSAQNK